MANRPCQTNLTLFFDEITILADKGNCKEVIDFCKTFVSALRDFLIKNLAPRTPGRCQGHQPWTGDIRARHRIAAGTNLGDTNIDSVANSREDRAAR